MASYLDRIPPEVGAMIQTYVDHANRKKACRKVVEKTIFTILTQFFAADHDVYDNAVFFRKELGGESSLTELITLQTQKLCALIETPEFREYVVSKSEDDEWVDDDDYELELILSVFPIMQCLNWDSYLDLSEPFFEMLQGIQ